MRAEQKTNLARHLRRRANTPERKAWAALPQLRSQGFPVRRQHPIGPYVADFAIVAERLVIEIDGGAHGIPGKAEADAKPQAAIEALGWRVMRLTDQEALDADYVLTRVQALLEARQ